MQTTTQQFVFAADPHADEHRATLLAALESRPPTNSRNAAPLPIHDATLTAFLASGLTSGQIARRTGVAEFTVTQRISWLLARIGLFNRAHLAATAIRERWIEWDGTCWTGRIENWPKDGAT